jgi:hypothetical protein
MFGFKQVLSVCCVHRCVPFSGSTKLPNVIFLSKANIIYKAGDEIKGK